MVLPVATVLDQHYEIQRPLDIAPPFSILYLGRELDTGRRVHIQEYFPDFIARRAEGDVRVRPVDDPKKASLYRTGMEYFRKEAGVLSALSHPNLIPEQAPFTANGTLYRVRPVRPGMTLARALEKKGGRLSVEDAWAVLKPIMDALATVHERGLLHGGVAPEAIYLQKQGGVQLHHFRSAGLQLARRADRLDEVMLPGLSPIEQYMPEGDQGPWTDVYGLAATMVRTVTGERPLEAPRRDESDDLAEQLDAAEALPESLREVLMRALAVDADARTRSVSAFREALQAARSSAADASSKDAPEEAAPSTDESTDSGHPEETAPDSTAVPNAESAPASDAPVEADEPSDPSIDEKEAEEPSAGAVDDTPPSDPGSLPDADEISEEPTLNEEPTPPDNEEIPSEDQITDEFPDEAAAFSRSPSDRPPRPSSHTASPAAEDGARTTASDSMRAVLKRIRGRRWKMRVMIPLAGFLLIGALAVWVWPSNEADSYTAHRARADSLYAEAQYAEAKTVYARALNIRPDDDHAAQRVERIEQMQADARRNGSYARRLAEGDSLSARADSLLQVQDAETASRVYRKARAAYDAASTIAPDRAGAATRLQSIDSLLASMGEEASSSEEEALATDQLFVRYRAQGDRAAEAGNYEVARRKYQEALEYRPDSPSVREQLDDVRRQLEREQRQTRHTALVARADSLYAQEQYAAAKAQYQQALAVLPQDTLAAARIQTIDSVLAEQERRDQQYQYHRGRGDVYFDQGEYRAAIQSYRQALEYRPGDEYAQSRMGESWQAMESARDGEQQSAPTSARSDTSSSQP